MYYYNMKKSIVNFIKKHIKQLKVIFICLVLSLIIIEFIKISKQLSPSKIKEIFYAIDLIKILIIIILGFVAVSPMINYDLIFNKYLNTKNSTKYVVEKSIIINTFNNLMGFGGIINIGLRSQYFSERSNSRQLIKLILKSYLFYFTGCSLIALIGLVHLAFVNADKVFNLWPWLIGGVIYYPIVLIISMLKGTNSIKISNKFVRDYSITSIFEWIFAFLHFFFIGYLMGVRINILDLSIIYVVGNFIGLISMIPGALGSFDILAITKLASYGIGQEFVLTWLLIYRASYYFIPFIVGFLLFMKGSRKSFIKLLKNIFYRI